ncbi:MULTISPECIES: serine/threonine-protein kinase [Microbacterium]|uniref:non-specific serine/threonine protein kinase n=1 Tax=Microbacterium hominis TaxID=162426 RepID=A0A2K9DP49_9MICO|nr:MULTISPECIES: serine/threonine-protein kinase [Microbacterium]AUG28966.1 serine/threonine protein kinase [Microbacterium hominis]
MDDRTSAVDVGMLLDARYRIDALIGTGGMSRVYAAHDLTLGRTVAIKIITATGDDLDAGHRVRVETAALAALTHPNLVVLHDARLTGPGPRYLVMERVDGPSLSARLAEGPLTDAELTRIAGELAEALSAVHAAGVVHRDIKPSNILLAPGATPSRPRRAKLADFGIAHLLGSERITQPGTLIGTAAYLAPEVALGHAPAPASDVYSLGLVLLEALSGARAFPSAQGASQLLARLAQDPDIPAELPPLWAGLLPAMLDRDPAARPSAAAIADTLAAPPRAAGAEDTRVLIPPLPPAEPAAAAAARFDRDAAGARPWWRRAPLLIGAGAAVAAIVIALSAWSGLSSAPSVEPSPTTTTPSSTPTPAATDASTVSNPDPVAPADPKDKGKDKGGPGENNGGKGGGPGKDGG